MPSTGCTGGPDRPQPAVDSSTAQQANQAGGNDRQLVGATATVVRSACDIVFTTEIPSYHSAAAAASPPAVVPRAPQTPHRDGPV